MRWLQLRHTLVCSLLLGAPASVLAQPAPDGYSYDDHYDTSIAGEPVASVDVFYDQLSPYGVWVEDPRLGRVFTPEAPRFVPYTVGHWQYTNVGFVWISAAPFEWATTHYGRWAYSRAFGRWVWRPDTVWGPSWVEWRMSGDDFGWAPLAPQIAIEVGYAPPVESWHYCSAARVLDVNVTRYYEPPSRVIEIHRAARPIEHYATISGTRVVVGPSAATLHERHVVARPTKIEAHTVGRWTPSESQAAAKRAQDRRPANEEQNRKRIESNVALRQAQTKIAASTPQRTDGKDGKPPASQPAPRQEPQVKQAPEPRKPEPRQPQVKQEPNPARPEPRQPQVKQEPRTPIKQEPRQVKPELRQPQVKEEPRPQVKQERQPESRPQGKQEPRPQVNQEPRPQARPERQPESRPQVKQEPPAKPEPRQPNPPPAKQAPRQEPRQADVKQEPKQPNPPPAKQERRPPEPRSETKQTEHPEPRTPPHKPDEK